MEGVSYVSRHRATPEDGQGIGSNQGYSAHSWFQWCGATGEVTVKTVTIIINIWMSFISEIHPTSTVVNLTAQQSYTVQHFLVSLPWDFMTHSVFFCSVLSCMRHQSTHLPGTRDTLLRPCALPVRSGCPSLLPHRGHSSSRTNVCGSYTLKRSRWRNHARCLFSCFWLAGLFCQLGGMPQTSHDNN